MEEDERDEDGDDDDDDIDDDLSIWPVWLSKMMKTNPVETTITYHVYYFVINVRYSFAFCDPEWPTHQFPTP